MPSNKEIGTLLCAYRKLKRINQKELARIISVKTVEISAVENGDFHDIQTFLKMCAALSVTPEMLLLENTHGSNLFRKDKYINIINSFSEKKMQLLMYVIIKIANETNN